MNDPGTAAPIEQAAKELDPEFSAGDKAEAKEEDRKVEQEERDYRDPNLYWFESTAVPLLAGTFGPIASAFNICSLSSSWRFYLPPGTAPAEGTVIDDPKWLLALNSVSVASALIANGALLLNMSRRLKFVIAQPITIIGFLLSTGLLMADLIAITASPTYQLPQSSPAAPAINHALTPAFYYAIMATAIYFFIALLMCWTVWGVYRGHFGRQFNLTAAQRTLMLQTMSFVTYLLLGALVFSHIEGWEYLEAVYWADVTLLTVGLGDFSPQTHLGRGLFIPFAIGGIVIIGLVIGSIRTLILQRGQKKISARMMEKKRVRAINSVDSNNHRIKVSYFQTIPFYETFSNASRQREQEFRVMRSVQSCAERDRKWMALCISTFLTFTLWLVGAVVFWVAERHVQGWTYFEAVYFSYTCLLTIGYGTPSPTSNSGRAFFVLWSLLAVPSLTILISDMSDTVVQFFSNVTIWIGTLTVLPGEGGFRATAKEQLKQVPISKLNPKKFASHHAPDFARGSHARDEETYNDGEHVTIHDRIADRLATHLKGDELHAAAKAQQSGDTLDRDLHFYHFVLACESKRLLEHLSASPPKQYEWSEWEYFLKLMAIEYDESMLTGQEVVPEGLRLPETKEEWEEKKRRYRWSWLGEKSPLMGHQTETEWILERLSACLEKELRNSRLLHGKRDKRTVPPISLRDLIKRGQAKDGGTEADTRGDSGDSGLEIKHAVESNMNREHRKDQ
ncbi:hypothetical protein AAFC00_005823 [Neodothiora populina]|uniref:Potassium channel domain-containing protein n=1 Tax=Neodothiora populina TaxID=2781224 RepID=A0ABR3P5Y9_9PEZI